MYSLFDNPYGGAPTNYGALDFDLAKQEEEISLLKKLGLLKSSGNNIGMGFAGAGMQAPQIIQERASPMQSLMAMAMTNVNNPKPINQLVSPYVQSLMGGL